MTTKNNDKNLNSITKDVFSINIEDKQKKSLRPVRSITPCKSWKRSTVKPFSITGLKKIVVDN